MEINTYIFLFSLLIFLVGFSAFVLTSKEFNKSEGDKFKRKPETGPRAEFFDLLYEAFSDDEGWTEKLRNADEDEIKDIVRKMNEARSKEN